MLTQTHNCAACRSNTAYTRTEGLTTTYTCTVCGKVETHTKKARRPKGTPSSTRTTAIEAAKALRERQTVPEMILGNALREAYGPNLFMEQWAIQGFVLDFYCLPLAVAIEVDGDTHERLATMARDLAQEAEIARRNGVTVRLTNAEVRRDLAGAMAKVHAAVVAQSPRLTKDKARPDLWRLSKALRKRLLAEYAQLK